MVDVVLVIIGIAIVDLLESPGLNSLCVVLVACCYCC